MIHYDNYVVGYTDDDKPIYDTKLSHTDLVKRARLVTGRREVASSNWYDEWLDDSDPKNPVIRVRAKMVMV